MTGRNRGQLPGPDLSGTDPNEVLRSRINLNVPVNPPSSTPAHTQVRAGKDRVRTDKGGGTRPDPDGMRRASIYVTSEAAKALEAAADKIVALLGDGTPRHVALSALLLAGADQVDAVAQELARQRAAELAARLAALPTIPE
ncbi:hypothetical protein [Nocardia asiatica]